MPDITSEDFGGKKAFYDYSTRPITERVPQKIAQNVQNYEDEYQPSRMSTYKPDHLRTLVNEPSIEIQV